MSEESKTDKADKEKLWKEHASCQNAALSVESPIWQTSGVIGIGLIGTLVLVANHPAGGQPPWKVAFIIGIYISVASWIWWLMARRWWSIQHAMFIRARYLEEELGVYIVRSVHLLDNPKLLDHLLDDQSSLSRSGLSREQVEELKGRTRGCFSPHQRLGVQKVLMLLPIMTSTVWALYVVYRAFDP